MQYMGIAKATDLIKVVLLICNKALIFQPTTFERTFALTSSKALFLDLPTNRGTPKYLQFFDIFGTWKKSHNSIARFGLAFGAAMIS